ncbi:MAG: hypothetical protein B0D92_07550 [Spirochaeta sp. LUC14_002_19_P3]|nr:MAG: hypothetical protein B0D92_07550 [Spirochaeta sp. LUC14_002_19_P3]
MADRGNALLRFLDRVFGIPVVFFVGLFSRRRKVPENIESIGVLAIAAIGDTILLSAVLRDLQSALGEVKLTVFCSRGNSAAVQLSTEKISQIIIPVKNPLKAVRLIRQSRFDVFIDFGQWPRLNSLLSFASRSRCHIGFRTIGQYRHYGYDIAVAHRRDCHELDNFRRLLEPLDIESRSLPSLGTAEPDNSNPYIVVHIFPSGYKAHYKKWSDANWIKLIRELNRLGYKVLLTGSAADSSAAKRIAAACGTDSMESGLIEVKAGSTSLAELATLLRKAQAVVSVNTGVMHLAAAYNQRLIALHGPTSVLRWGPLCEHKYNLTASTKSAGCLHLGFEYDRRDPRSMDTIHPDRVLEALRKLLSG